MAPVEIQNGGHVVGRRTQDATNIPLDRAFE